MQVNFKYTVKTEDVRGEQRETTVIHPWLSNEFPSKSSLRSMSIYFAKVTLESLTEAVNADIILTEVIIKPQFSYEQIEVRK